MDMTATIQPKSDQLNADSFVSGPRTIRISRVTGNPDFAEQPVSVHYEGGEGKPYKPCKTMRRVMVDVWGADASTYVGKSMTLYTDPTVKWGGLQVGGIRISHMSDMDGPRTLAVTVTKGQRKPMVVKPLQAAPKAAQRPPVDDPDDLPPAEPRYSLEDAELEGADAHDRESVAAWWKRCKAASRKAHGDEAQAWGKLLAEAQERGERLAKEVA